MTSFTRRRAAMLGLLGGLAPSLPPAPARAQPVPPHAKPDDDGPDIDAFLSHAEGEGGAEVNAFLGPGGTDVPFWARLTEAERPSVTWAADRQAPDYLGLADEPASADSFRITADTLMQHAALNGFALPPKGAWPQRGPGLLFGLRGCVLVSRAASFGPSLELRESTPNHQTFQCTLGILRPDGTLAGFPASTVCNADYMYVQTKLASGKYANLLPTGMHGYKVGTHRASSPNPLPAALLQQRQVMVLRTRKLDDNKMQFRASDDWDGPLLPCDNIHAAYGDDDRRYPLKFDSAGCQVIPGYFREGRMTGPWAEFCRALGTVGADYVPDTSRNDDTAQYTYMLLTGREARLLAAGKAEAGLKRLRFGSAGPAVTALRAKLRLRAGDQFDASVQAALIKWQQDQAPRATAILTPAEAAELGVTL